MALPTRITAVEISAERDHPVYHARAVEPEANTPQARARGNLYILLNLHGAGTGQARLSRQMLNTIQALYYEQTTGSVTYSLTQAILAAHEALRHANTTSQATWRGSVACLIIRGRDLFLGHAGPVVSFVAHPDTVDQFPARIPEDEVYLGDEAPPDVEFFHTQLRGDTAVLLADAGWLQRVSAREMAAIVAASDQEAGIRYLREVAQETGLASILIDIEAEPEAWSHIPGIEAQPRRPPTSAVPPTSAPAEPEMPPDVGGRPTRSAPTSHRTPPHIPRSVTRPPRSVPVREEPIETAQEPQAPHPAWEPAVEEEPWPEEATEEELLEEEFWEEVPSAEAEPPSRPAWRFSLPRIRLTRRPPPERREERPAKAAPSRPQPGSSKWALFVAIAIPILIALLVGAAYWQRGVTRAQKLQELLDEAKSQLTLASTTTDPAQAQAALIEAETLLDQAELLQPTHPDIQQLRMNIQEQRDRIEQVEMLYLTLTLKEFGEGRRDPGRVVVSGDNVFILDRGLDRVDHYRLSSERDGLEEVDAGPLLSKGQNLGGAIVGEMVDMVWVPAGDGRNVSALLILDADGNLWQWMENLGLTRIEFNTKPLRYPQKLGTYFGRLYLMDTQANAIWRYIPTTNGYANEPEPYFAEEFTGSIDLGGAVDFSIDGNIWILFADGRVLKFFQGQQQPFSFSGFPGRLQAPAALVAGRNEGTTTERLYIGDARTGRIIEFGKDGRFIRQMRPTRDALQFQDMRSLFVDETERAFYILTGKGLYKAPIPPE